MRTDMAGRLLTRLRDLDTVLPQFAGDPLGELTILRGAIEDIRAIAGRGAGHE